MSVADLLFYPSKWVMQNMTAIHQNLYISVEVTCSVQRALCLYVYSTQSIIPTVDLFNSSRVAQAFGQLETVEMETENGSIHENECYGKIFD